MLGRNFIMPKTKREELVFTAMTSGLMIFIMGVYNVAINNNGLEYASFVQAARTFPLEWLIGFLLAFFVANKTAKHFAFHVVTPADRKIFVILSIQIFTVCTMVPLMSLVGTIEAHGLTCDLPIVWLNFIMAYPLQLLVAGPVCRRIFHKLFREKKDMQGKYPHRT